MWTIHEAMSLCFPMSARERRWLARAAETYRLLLAAGATEFECASGPLLPTASTRGTVTL